MKLEAIAQAHHFTLLFQLMCKSRFGETLVLPRFSEVNKSFPDRYIFPVYWDRLDTVVTTARSSGLSLGYDLRELDKLAESYREGLKLIKEDIGAETKTICLGKYDIIYHEGKRITPF